ncbi:hypothetical protein OSTOST_24709 [Ostertagia ostertagi]
MRQRQQQSGCVYKELEEATKKERSYYKYVVGDFNAVITRKSRRQRALDHRRYKRKRRAFDGLLEQCNLFHGNSFFMKNVGRRWTWESPNAAAHSEIDHILTNRKWSLLDVSVVDAFRTGSDHRLVRAKKSEHEQRSEELSFHCAPLTVVQAVHEDHSKQTGKTTDDYQAMEQAGFRKGFCCVDHIHTATQLIERAKEYKYHTSTCLE